MLNPGDVQASITFTSTTQKIKTPTDTFAVATSGAQFTAYVLTVTGNQIQTPYIDAPVFTSPPFNVPLTVTNSTDQEFYSQFSWTITATDGKTICRPTTGVKIMPHTVVSMGCGLAINTAEPQMPAATWNDTTSIPGLQFVGQNAAWVEQYSQVPAGCGDATPAVNALKTYLSNTLDNTKPPLALSLGDGTFDINYASLTCTPPAGTTAYDKIAYTQALSGSFRWLYYFPADVTTYQTQQLQAQVPSNATLLSSNICTYPTVIDASANSGHVSCPATGVVAWQWTGTALSALAQQIAGKSISDATAILNATPGIASGSVQISVKNGGTTLPSDPSQISIAANS